MPSPSTPLQNRRRPAAIAIGPQTSTRSISVVPATDAVFALSGDVTLSAGDLEIGAVELKNATTDDRAKIAVPATIAAGDIVVGVHDPVLNVAQWLGSTAPSVGQKAKTASLPVTLASDEDAVLVDGQGTAGTPVGGVVSVQGVAGGQPIPVSGIASNPSVGTDNAAKPSSDTLIGGSDGTNLQAARIFDADSGVGTQYVLGVSLRKTASGGSTELGTSSDPVRIDPTGSTIQPTNVAQWLGSTAPSVGQKTAANSLPVVLASDQNQAANAAVVTSVAGSASSVTLLAANTARISASISNDSTATLYAKFGATASTSSFTVRIPANVYYEVPVGRDGKVYNGRIDGIWSVALGNARITEVA